jgi:hypothetical protein
MSHFSLDNSDSSTKHCRTFEWILTRISRELHSREVIPAAFAISLILKSYWVLKSHFMILAQYYLSLRAIIFSNRDFDPISETLSFKMWIR